MENRRVALITGGSSGLGFSFARQLAKEGYVPILIARRKTKLDAAVRELRDMGCEAAGFTGSVDSEKDMKGIFAKVKELFGKIDFLILNAGIVNVSLLQDYDNYSEMKKEVDVDLWGTILTTRIFLPLMPDCSRILMISSAFGLIGGAGYSVYCAAKAGIINFARAIRRELISRKIGVHVACPADIDTPQYACERESMPDWMADHSSGRKSLISPDTAARKILKKCRKGMFLIIINSEITLLDIVCRFLPRKLSTYIVDISLPHPG